MSNTETAMILKTYSRLFSHDCDVTLETLERLHGRKAHLRFKFGDWDLAGIGDMFVVAGTEESLAPIRDSHGPVIVQDIEAFQAELLASGATISVRKSSDRHGLLAIRVVNDRLADAPITRA